MCIRDSTYTVTYVNIPSGVTGTVKDGAGDTMDTVTRGSGNNTIDLANGTYTVEWTGTGYTTQETTLVVNGADVYDATQPAYLAVTIGASSTANGVTITGVDYSHVVSGETVNVTVDLSGFTGSVELLANGTRVYVITGGAATQNIPVEVTAATEFTLAAI